MAAAGLELHEDLTQKAVMWVSRVLTNLRYFWNLYLGAKNYFAQQRPDAVILIDYPGFNWWIARAAKKFDVPVIYYGTPQLWAWAPWRVRKMRRLVDHALCKLPFEERWFRARGVNATYVGHPYFDELERRKLDIQFVDEMRSADSDLITILPGSRDQEVEHNLPGLLRSAQLVHRQVPNTRFAIASFNQRQMQRGMQIANAYDIPLDFHTGKTPELIEAATCCLACSGSVSLELLYHGKPAVVLYKIGAAGYAIQSVFRTSKYITLTNLLADHHQLAPPVPEFLTCRDVSDEVSHRILAWLNDDATYEQNRQTLGVLRTRDGHGGASRVAADYILKHVQSSASGSLRAA